MSADAVTSSHFTEVKNSILSDKANPTVDTENDASTMSVSGLSYSITESNEEAINFSTLDMDFVIHPTGTVNMLQVEDGVLEVYEVEDGEFKDSLLEFLTWRSKVLTSVGV